MPANSSEASAVSASFTVPSAVFVPNVSCHAYSVYVPAGSAAREKLPYSRVVAKYG